MNYRFEPTGEVRYPRKGEWYQVNCGSNLSQFMVASVDHCIETAPIFRRVPHEDTSCEVAFARMWLAEFFAGTLPVDMEREYAGLKYRFANSERSPELTALMVQLTERMTNTKG